MGEGYAAIHRGGGLPLMGGVGSLMTHSAGSVTIRRKAPTYVMAGLPYIKIYFFITLIALKVKCF
jgi:hypothetical protein